MDDEQLAALPPASFGGQYPTLNQRGFMSPDLDDFGRYFASVSADATLPVVDLGCAYGIATLAALAEGATVLAIDMERGHLDKLEEICPPADRARLTTQVGVMPGGVDLATASTSVVHTARMLHFLAPDDVMRSLDEIHDWIVPGGTVVITVETPYSGIWAPLAERYEERKAAGEPWPGYIDDVAPIFAAMGQSKPEAFVDAMHLMDEDVLGRALGDAGFEVAQLRTFTRHPTSSGRDDQLGAVAVRR